MNNKRLRSALVGLGLILAPSAPCLAQAIRLKDISRIQTQRSNQLYGVGLVQGLAGTGDGQQFPLTVELLRTVFKNLNINSAVSLRTKNLAAVFITVEIPAFAKNGDKLDVTVASMGDAKSLQGGILLQTPLQGADGQVYAVAQGPISIGGFSAGQGGNRVSKNHPTVGRIPNGAIVEEEIPTNLESSPGMITLNLRNDDFGTCVKVAQAINKKLGEGTAIALDAKSVQIRVPLEFTNRLPELIAEIETLRVNPDAPARIVINERTGTVVIGANVRILPVAIAHSNLTIDIQKDFLVSQPAPFGPRGSETVVVPQNTVKVEETRAEVAEFNAGVTLGELVKALNALRMTARDIVAILQAIKDTGALQGELVIQ